MIECKEGNASQRMACLLNLVSQMTLVKWSVISPNEGFWHILFRSFAAFPVSFSVRTFGGSRSILEEQRGSYGSKEPLLGEVTTETWHESSIAQLDFPGQLKRMRGDAANQKSRTIVKKGRRSFMDGGTVCIFQGVNLLIAKSTQQGAER